MTTKQVNKFRSLQNGKKSFAQGQLETICGNNYDLNVNKKSKAIKGLITKWSKGIGGFKIFQSILVQVAFNQSLTLNKSFKYHPTITDDQQFKNLVLKSLFKQF